MQANSIALFIFCNLLSIIFSVVQDWDMENSSIDVFTKSNPFYLDVYTGQKDDGTYVLLQKIFTKDSSGAISFTRKLTFSKGYNDNIYIGEVAFENIESFYHIGDDYIICPKGKFHPTYFYNYQYSNYNPDNFEINGDWELKCYHHHTGFFLVFYLMNGNSQFYYKKLDTNTWTKKNLHQDYYTLKRLYSKLM